MSDWNLFLERKLALDLGLEASRLADAIARCTLGWRKRDNQVGRELLRDFTRLHGRSFERAREELVASGLIRFTPGSRGRGHRDQYELLLDEENAAEERPFLAENAAENAAQSAAPERQGRENGERKIEDPAPAPAAQRQRGRGRPGPEAWPKGLGKRTLGDLIACCHLVEDLQTGADQDTLRAFVVDELAYHHAAQFEYVANELAVGRLCGVGNPRQPIKSEAAFARSVLRDILNGYELRAPC